MRRVSDLKDESLSQMAANPEEETSGSKENKIKEEENRLRFVR